MEARSHDDRRGAAPQVQAAAKRRLLAEQLRAIADVELDAGYETDPAEAVLGALRAAHERLRLPFSTCGIAAS